jgi:hypothetical protein
MFYRETFLKEFWLSSETEHTGFFGIRDSSAGLYVNPITIIYRIQYHHGDENNTSGTSSTANPAGI